MERKVVSGMMFTLLLIGMLTLGFNVRLVEAGTITVPDDYPTIQEAINAANPGDTIIVSVGLYAEGQINVNKSLSLLADGGVLVDGLSKGHVFYVTASHVTIKGFTIKNAFIPGTYSGVTLRNVRNCTVSGNIIRQNAYGILLSLSNNNTIIGNTVAISSVTLKDSSNNKITNNTIPGVSLTKSNNNILSGNTITLTGVRLSYSRNNTIINNNLKNSLNGVILSKSNNNTVSGNTFKKIFCSISLSNSSNNTITTNDSGWGKLDKSNNNKFRNNNFTGFGVFGQKLSHFINDVDVSNTVYGKPIYYWINKRDMKVPSDAGYVAIVNSTRIIVENLTLPKGQWLGAATQGIALAFTTNSTIKNNCITENYYGIWIYVSNDNTIYHNNIVGNWKPVYSEGTNIWDDGYPSGGNYWSGYEEADEYSGPDQDQPGSDGIGDYPRLIDMFNRDRFPLLRPIKFFDAGTWNEVNYYVDITSKSTVSNFQLNTTVKTISFNVAGSGFCRVTIPNIIVQDLWQGNYTVLVDGEPPLDIRNWTTTENTYIYFTYQSEHEVIIIPEFPTAIIMPLFMIISMLAVALAKRKSKMRK